ncbi:MAG TPA: gas vesicle protein GvpJ [Candidatus Angelobacter sp.]
MAVQRVSGGSSLVDVLDRILDKGIVIDAWARISLAGIDLGAGKTRLAVARPDGCLESALAGGPAGALDPAKSGTAGEKKRVRRRR